jgi:hypothetical protein
VAALSVKTGERVRARLLVRMTQMGCAVDVIDGRRDVELLRVRMGILGRHGRRHAHVSRADYSDYAGTHPEGNIVRRVPAITVWPTDVGPFHTIGDTSAAVGPRRLRQSGEVVVQRLFEMGAAE